MKLIIISYLLFLVSCNIAENKEENIQLQPEINAPNTARCEVEYSNSFRVCMQANIKVVTGEDIRAACKDLTRDSNIASAYYHESACDQSLVLNTGSCNTIVDHHGNSVHKYYYTPEYNEASAKADCAKRYGYTWQSKNNTIKQQDPTNIYLDNAILDAIQ